MIVVALGTHGQPMDRLLRELDRLVETGALRDEVVVQAAVYGYRPRHLTTHGILPADELDRLLERADVVVAHAGPGILAGARAARRTPVVVPRQRAFGEHIDDHQLHYARRLRDQPGYEVVLDLADLPEAIERARSAGFDAPPVDRSRAIAALQRITGCR